MTESGVPVTVRDFVAKHIESVTQLEVPLLRAAGDKRWTAREVASAPIPG